VPDTERQQLVSTDRDLPAAIRSMLDEEGSTDE